MLVENVERIPMEQEKIEAYKAEAIALQSDFCFPRCTLSDKTSHSVRIPSTQNGAQPDYLFFVGRSENMDP